MERPREIAGVLARSAAVAAGGFAGTAARLGVNAATASSTFPIGTLVENLLGSLLLGLVAGWILERKLPAWVRAGLGVGFCGGFTTMSTLASDLVFLAGVSPPAHAAAYLAASLAGGVALAAGGLWLGAYLGARAPRGEAGREAP